MRTLWNRNKDKQENGPKAEKQVIPETRQIEETTPWDRPGEARYSQRD